MSVFLLLKAAVKKQITVPGYYKKDGTYVKPHVKTVLYDPAVDHKAVIGGQGSHYQKIAHKKLKDEVQDWHKLSDEDKHAIILSHATDLQKQASLMAAISMWKKAALAGKNPTKGQWKAFNKLDASEQAKLMALVKEKVGSIAHLVDTWNASGSDPASSGSDKLVTSLGGQWDKHLLPASNSNAKHHNSVIAKIKNLYEQGDLDGLKALYEKKSKSKQTYAKKQANAALEAIGMLSGSDSEPSASSEESKANPKPSDAAAQTNDQKQSEKTDGAGAGVEDKDAKKLAKEMADNWAKKMAAYKGDDMVLHEGVVPLIGGKKWVSSTGEVRYYFNDLENLVGLNLSYYKTGNVSDATFNGEKISNSKAKKILSSLIGAKVWYSQKDGKIHWKNLPDWAEEPIKSKIFSRIYDEIAGGDVKLAEKVGHYLGDLDFKVIPSKTYGALLALPDGVFTPKKDGEEKNVKKALKEVGLDVVEVINGDVLGGVGKKTKYIKINGFLEDGPKEGDVKTIDGVSYVLKNGRWHKLGVVW